MVGVNHFALLPLVECATLRVPWCGPSGTTLGLSRLLLWVVVKKQFVDPF